MSAVLKHADFAISRARSRGRTRALSITGMDSTTAFGSALTSERGRLPIVPFGSVGKFAPTLRYLKVDFFDQLILRSLG